MRHLEALFSRRSDAKPVDKGKDLILGDVLDDMGFGWYQLQVWILCSGFIMAEGAEVQMAAGLVNAMQDEFHIVGGTGKALLMMFTFLGFVLGTSASGPLGDTLGRLNPMILGYSGVIVTGCCTTLVTSLNMMYFMRLVLGFFASIGIPSACITIAEVTPSMLRGKATAALGFAYIMGELWAACGLSILMPDLEHGNWRLLILWATIPAFCFICLGLVSRVTRYDTPYFLASRGKTAELHEVLNLMAELNDKPHLKVADQDKVLSEVAEEIRMSAALPTLLRPPVVSNLLAMCCLFFAKDFAYFGTNIFWPQAWATFHNGLGLDPANDLLCTAFFGIPGVMLAIVLMNYLSRRHGVVLCATICGISVLLLRGLQTGSSSALIGVMGFKLFFPTIMMTILLLSSELFGTQIRGWAFAFGAAFGRLACVLCPFGVAFGINAFTGVVAALLFGIVFVVLLLPETKDCDLVEDAMNTAPSRRHLLKDIESASYGAAEKVIVL